MRLAVGFLVLLLACAAGTMYVTAWRHGTGVGERALAASADEPGGLQRPEANAGSPSAPDTADPTPPGPEGHPATQVWYQYVDARGSVRFASSLGEVPAAQRDAASRMEMSRLRKTPGASGAATRRRAAYRPSEVQDQVWGGDSGGGDVIIYTTSWCGACKKAVAWLEDKGIDYEEKDIEDDPDAEAEYLRKAQGRRGVPLIDVRGQIMQGFSPSRLQQMLASRG